jgi:hypothetical protein
MLGRLLRRLREWTGRDEETAFAGSLLDRSVRYAHGGSGEDAERELERVRSDAEELARAREHRRE